MRTAFTQKMYELCELAPKRVKGYYPGDFRRSLEHAGNDFAPRAREFLRAGLQSGIETLAKGRALDISMEWSIAYDDWPEFGEEDRRLAHERLTLLAKMNGLDAPPAITPHPAARSPQPTPTLRGRRGPVVK
jgi:hypothetical protein